jgi:hypothetical protein
MLASNLCTHYPCALPLLCDSLTVCHYLTLGVALSIFVVFCPAQGYVPGPGPAPGGWAGVLCCANSHCGRALMGEQRMSGRCPQQAPS